MSNQNQDVQHPLYDVDPAHVAKLQASSHHQGAKYSPSFIFFTAVQPVVELFDSFDLLDCTKERGMVLHDDCRVGVVHQRHYLNVWRSLHRTTNMALQSTSYQIHLSYISREDGNFLSAREIIIRAATADPSPPCSWATPYSLTSPIAS